MAIETAGNAAPAAAPPANGQLDGLTISSSPGAVAQWVGRQTAANGFPFSSVRPCLLRAWCRRPATPKKSRGGSSKIKLGFFSGRLRSSKLMQTTVRGANSRVCKTKLEIARSRQVASQTTIRRVTAAEADKVAGDFLPPPNLACRGIRSRQIHDVLSGAPMAHGVPRSIGHPVLPGQLPQYDWF